MDPDFFRHRRWAWRSGPCAAVGHRFEITSEPLHELRSLLGPLVTPLRAQNPPSVHGHYRIVRHRNPEVPYALYYGGMRLTLATRPESLVRFLTWHINRQMVDKSSAEHVVLHAAAATRAGITVMLPGDQEHGKTTTVAGLLREGYEYVTDEAVAIDPATLHITPFPKALSIDDGAWPLFPECRPLVGTEGLRQWQVPAEQLGSQSMRGAVSPPTVVVFPMFVAGSTTRCSQLSRGEAVRELAQGTFHFTQRPARNLATLVDLTRGATVARLRIGSLDGAVRAIETLVSQRLMEKL
ncbi:MAG TPA: hypothetical protein VFJ14_01365 [Nocardioidaceae bacterium]|nr:hypothetical protein [Nocardioidaceae bacterium]